MAPGSGRGAISWITDEVCDEMAEWSTRLLDRIYPVIFMDAIVVKVRDGQEPTVPSTWP